MVNYLLVSFLAHSVLLLSFWGAPDFRNTSPVEVKFVEKAEVKQKAQNLPTSGKPLIPGPERKEKIKNYGELLKSIVDPIWVSKVDGLRGQRNKVYEIIVLLSVSKSGIINSIRIGKSSGVASFDALAIETFREIGRIPNPPESVVEHGIEWSLVF